MNDIIISPFIIFGKLFCLSLSQLHISRLMPKAELHLYLITTVVYVLCPCSDCEKNYHTKCVYSAQLRRKSSAKKLTMKSSARSSAKAKAPRKSAKEQTEMNFPMEHQSPLESLSEHMPEAGATKEMGVSVAAHAPKKAPLPKKIKDQNKIAKNVSHARSHSSQYRG